MTIVKHMRKLVPAPNVQKYCEISVSVELISRHFEIEVLESIYISENSDNKIVFRKVYF